MAHDTTTKRQKATETSRIQFPIYTSGEDNGFKLPSGKNIYVNNGILGIGPDLDLHEGSDGGYGLPDETAADIVDALHIANIALTGGRATGRS